MTKKCVITVNESLARDEVLVNFDLLGLSVKPGTLMAVDVLVDRPGHASLRKHPSHESRREVQETGSSLIDGTSGRRFLFMAKDIPRDMKPRLSNVELYVAKQVADAFGMRKGSIVLLTQVSILFSSALDDLADCYKG